MHSEETPPTRDELLAMAYVDGELEESARVEFVGRMAREPALAREVAELQGLELIARRMAPPEPADTEWARIESELVHRGGTWLGFALLLVGVLGPLIWGVVGIARSDELGLAAKLLLASGLAGIALLFLLVLRARLRTLPFDPYTKIQR